MFALSAKLESYGDEDHTYLSDIIRNELAKWWIYCVVWADLTQCDMHKDSHNDVKFSEVVGNIYFC